MWAERASQYSSSVTTKQTDYNVLVRTYKSTPERKAFTMAPCECSGRELLEHSAVQGCSSYFGCAPVDWALTESWTVDALLLTAAAVGEQESGGEAIDRQKEDAQAEVYPDEIQGGSARPCSGSVSSQSGLETRHTVQSG